METGLLCTIKEKQKNRNLVITTNFNNTHLSIQLRSDGFCFCIIDRNTETISNVTYLAYPKTATNPSSQLDFIKEQFEKQPLLKEKYKNVNVTHSNNLSTFVPKPFFKKENLADYLKYNIKVLQNDFIAIDTIDTADMVNVYIPHVHINNFLFDVFGGFEYKHTSTVLIDTLLKENSTSDKTKFYAHVENDIFQVVVLEGKKVRFFNTFNYKTKEDFIYYILFVAEQLKLNPEEFQLILMNDIEKESALYEIAYKYIKNIRFYEPSYSIPKELNISNHSNFTLLNQHR